MGNTIWLNTHRYLYNIEVDGVSERIIHDGQLDYKKTIAAIKANRGAKKVFITFLGRVTF